MTTEHTCPLCCTRTHIVAFFTLRELIEHIEADHNSREVTE